MADEKLVEEVARGRKSIHDVFNGTQNCVDCGGPCRLEGDAKLATSFVRHFFEFLAVTQDTGRIWMWPQLMADLRDMGVDVDRFCGRALAATWALRLTPSAAAPSSRQTARKRERG